jgi:hypothetical protein
MVVMKTEKLMFNNNKSKDNAELMLFILNCTLLHNQKDGWTPPCPVFNCLSSVWWIWK